MVSESMPKFLVKMYLNRHSESIRFVRALIDCREKIFQKIHIRFVASTKFIANTFRAFKFLDPSLAEEHILLFQLW